jgi:choline dehydrogenase-like flavoprotein
VKSNWEVPTSRANPNQTATRPLGAVGPMMNAVGGTSIHWMTQSWRFLPWNFKMISESIKRYGPSAIPKDCTSIDWPFDYAEIEPYYDKHEHFAGVSARWERAGYDQPQGTSSKASPATVPSRHSGEAGSRR